MQSTRRGSTKVMTAVEPGVIALRYTKKWSAFDRGASPQEIPGLDAARCACAVESFDRAGKAGWPTHYIEQVDPVTIHVLEFAVPGHESLSGKVHGTVLDAEWIRRVYAAGSLLDRLRSGKAKPEDFGFPAGTEVVEGMKLPRMVKECTTKFEMVDRHLTDEEIRQRVGITLNEWDDIWRLIEGTTDATEVGYQEAGFYRPDGKGEIARRSGGGFIQVDVFGTQDEDRIIEKSTGKLYSKDLIRNYLKKLPWKGELDAAKAKYPLDKSKWPPYPLLPDELVELVSRRYAEVAQRYAGVEFDTAHFS